MNGRISIGNERNTLFYDWSSDIRMDKMDCIRHMKIGIDFDSAIAKIDQPLLDELNVIRGTKYRAEEWSDWNLSFLKPEERRLLLRLLTPDLYKKVLPYPGAREAIRSLSKKRGLNSYCAH